MKNELLRCSVDSSWPSTHPPTHPSGAGSCRCSGVIQDEFPSQSLASINTHIPFLSFFMALQLLLVVLYGVDQFCPERDVVGVDAIKIHPPRQ